MIGKPPWVHNFSYSTEDLGAIVWGDDSCEMQQHQRYFVIRSDVAHGYKYKYTTKTHGFESRCDFFNSSTRKQLSNDFRFAVLQELLYVLKFRQRNWRKNLVFSPLSFLMEGRLIHGASFLFLSADSDGRIWQAFLQSGQTWSVISLHGWAV
jgi:hypothetical protein